MVYLAFVQLINCKVPKKLWRPGNFAVIYLKFKQRSQIQGISSKRCNGVANNEDPDQTALEEQSDLGLHCLPRPTRGYPEVRGQIEYLFYLLSDINENLSS